MPITQTIYLFISSAESQTQYRTSPSTFTCICRGEPASRRECIWLKASQRRNQRHSFTFRARGSLLEKATNKQESGRRGKKKKKKQDSGVHTFCRLAPSCGRSCIHSCPCQTCYTLCAQNISHCLHTHTHNSISLSQLPANSFHTCELFNFAQKQSWLK